jgi:voltage-gated potassium channel
MANRRRIFQGLFLVAAVTVAGTIAYIVAEDLSLLDAVYLTAITISTVGFDEPTGGFSSAGQLITIGVVVVGVSAVLYTASGFAEIVLDALIGDKRRHQREAEMIAKLEDHIIVCGYGRVGRRVYDLVASEGFDVVVIETAEDRVAAAQDHGAMVIHGDAGRDEYLEAAGIDTAQGLVACVGTDSDNLSIVLSGRARQPGLFIVARGGDGESRRKLRLAGADRVVAPEAAGAERLARLISHRELTEFVEVAAGDRRLEFEIDELTVGDRAVFAGKSLAESKIRSECGVLVLAVHHADGVISAPPSAGTRIRAGDVLISLGTSDQLDALRILAGGG